MQQHMTIRREFLWQLGLTSGLILLFTALRVINLQDTMLWSDDLSTLPSLDFIEWHALPGEISDRLRRITGPIFPTALGGVLVNLFGLSALMLRLPSLFAAILGLVLFQRVLQQLFPTQRTAQWLLLILFTFSIPSIMYAQQIQPTAYYFLGTSAQLLAFIPLYRTTYGDPRLRQRMLIFVGVSTSVFFINYLSVLIAGLLSASWSLRLFDDTWIRKRLSMRRGISLFLTLFVLHIPLFGLILNVPYAGHPGRTYFYNNYFIDAADFVRYSYDMITYHFNFVFDPSLYYPLGINPLSIPFVMLVLYGGVLFLRRARIHSVYALLTVLIVFFVARLAMYPYGGVRHSFTLAPILYIFLGYALVNLTAHPHLKRTLPVGLTALAIIPWLIWGTGLYSGRDTQLDAHSLAQLADEHTISTIAAHSGTSGILRFQTANGGDVLDDVTVMSFAGETDLAQVDSGEAFLLVSTRTAINPTWESPFGLSPPEIPCEMCPFRITPLIEDTGPLPYEGNVAQSIYWPMNGRFIYLVEPPER